MPAKRNPRRSPSPSVERRSHSSMSRSMTSLDFVQDRIGEHERRIAELEKLVSDLSVNTSGKVAPPTPVPGHSGGEKKPKVLSTEQDEAMLRRLTRPKKLHDEELPDIPGFKATSIDAETLEELVDRLGQRDIDRRRDKAADVEQTEIDNLPLTRLQEDRGMTTRLELSQQEAMGKRLCDDYMTKKNQKVQRMRAVLVEENLGAEKEYEGDVAAAVTERVYNNSVAKKAEVRGKMAERYLTPTELPKKKLSKEAQLKMAERLSHQK